MFCKLYQGLRIYYLSMQISTQFSFFTSVPTILDPFSMTRVDSSQKGEEGGGLIVSKMRCTCQDVLTTELLRHQQTVGRIRYRTIRSKNGLLDHRYGMLFPFHSILHTLALSKNEKCCHFN